MYLAAVAVVLLAAAPGRGSSTSLAEEPTSATVIGPINVLLADGVAALEQGRAEEGIRLTLEGLEIPTSVRDRAAAHANLCAGYMMLKRWDEALRHCNESIALDSTNWRAFNNRAAAYAAKGHYDLAIMDVQSGLKLAPNSSTLKRSLEVVYERKQAMRERVARPAGAG